MSESIDIVEVSRRSGVRASTLRYYEEKGLIRSRGRRGLRRLFDPSVVERLSLVALGQMAGFSLDDIARMFVPDGRVRIDRTLLGAKADELDATIERLTALRNGLRHAAACPAESHMECPRFRAIVRLARVTRLRREDRTSSRGARRSRRDPPA